MLKESKKILRSKELFVVMSSENGTDRVENRRQ